MKKIILILFLYPLLVFGQGRYYGNPSDATALCKIRVDAVRSFSSNKDAEIALQKIIAVTGVAKRFALYQCNGIMNCEALTYRGIRYIFYDSDFMRVISNKSSGSWTNISILAHEVGHHVNGHALDWLSYQTGEIGGISLAEKRRQEIEADEFSGFVLYKLGATLHQAQAAINKFGFDEDDSYSDHPNKIKRLAAIKRGYNRAKNTNTINKNKTLTGDDYFYLALNAPKDSHQYIINNYSKCISLNSKYKEFAYGLRGMTKDNLKDYSGAIEDYSKAIEINPKGVTSYIFYFKRGTIKGRLEDYSGAIEDYSKAIEINPKDGDSYNLRGVLKYELKDYSGAISDISKAIDLGTNNAVSYYSRGGAKSNTGDYSGAIEEYSKAIELDPNYALAYYNRGISKKNLKDYYGAIEDYNKAIEIDPKFANAYYNRGIAKANTGDSSGACKDFKKACKLGSKFSCKIYKKGCK